MDPQALLEHLGATVARATVLFAVALAAAALMRRASAAARHRLWTAATLGALALPFCRPLPRVTLEVLPPPVIGLETLAAYEPPPWTPPPWPAARPDAADELPQLLLAPRTRATWPLALAAVWLLGAAIVLRRFLLGRLRAARFLASTRPADPSVWPRPPDLDVREGDAVELPMTVGALRAIILVPAAEGRRWSADWRAAVLEHETAHVRRRDPLWQLLSELACALYWFHPLAWLAARQLRIERELAADDDVLARGLRPSDYAELLVTLGCLPAVAPASGAVVPLLTPSGLKARLLGIIDARRRRGLGRPARWVLAALGLCVFLPTASAVLVRRPPADTQFYPGALLACARDQQTGAPLAGADVDLWDDTAVVERLLTDADGCFRSVRGVPRSGQFIAYIRKGPIAGRKGMRSGKYGTRLPSTIDVRPAHAVSGMVLDHRGQPLAGAQVRVVWSRSFSKGPGPDAVAVSGADGRFRFEGLLYGGYRMLFQSPSGGLATGMAEVGDTDVAGMDIAIPEPWPITGSLRDGAGHPVAGARVEETSFFQAEPGRAVRGRHIDWDLSDETGAFRLVQLGRSLRASGRDRDGRLLMAFFSERRSARGRSVNSASGVVWQETPYAGDSIVMQPAGIVSGHVRFADGTAVVGAMVQAASRAPGGGFRPIAAMVAKRTDQSGRFVVGPLMAPEDVDVQAFFRVGSASFRGTLRVPVRGEHDPPVEIILEDRR
jgi:hypothetical protein